jgi:hypothetical protein
VRDAELKVYSETEKAKCTLNNHTRWPWGPPAAPMALANPIGVWVGGGWWRKEEHTTGAGGVLENRKGILKLNSIQ